MTANADQVQDPRMAALDRQSARSWQEAIAEDRELGQIELGIARCARLMVMEPLSSPIHAEAKREDIQLRERRRRLLETRHAAKATPA